MVSLMYSVVTHVSNSMLNYNLNYNSLLVKDLWLYLGYCERGFCYETLIKFCTETCWVHSNTKSLTHQGHSRWFVLADLPRPVILHAKFCNYTSALLNETNNKQPCLFAYKFLLLHCSGLKVHTSQSKIIGHPHN